MPMNVQAVLDDNIARYVSHVRKQRHATPDAVVHATMVERATRLQGRSLAALCVLGLALGNATAHSAEPGADATLAVIAGEGGRAPPETLVARLEVALSRDRAIRVLDRAHVKKLLAEHELTAAGLTSPESAIRLGQLLSADLLLIVEKLPEGKARNAGPTLRTPRNEPTTAGSACRLRIVEVRTGIALGSLAESEAMLQQDPSLAVHAATSAIKKMRTPRADRRLVSILGVRSEEPGRTLDSLAEALGMLLAHDLSRSPNIVMIDREHLDHLRKESELTGIELGLRASAHVLQGGVRRAPDGDKLLLTASVRSPGGEGMAPATADAPAGDITALRKALADAFLTQLAVTARATVPGDSEAEARTFYRRALLLRNYREHEEAIRAAETAAVLAPKRGYRALASSLWSNLAYAMTSEAGRCRDAEERVRHGVRALQAALRWLDADTALVYDFFEGRATRLSYFGRNVAMITTPYLEVRSVLRHCRGKSQEFDALFRELQELSRSRYRRCVAYYASAEGRARDWHDCVATGLGDFQWWTDDVREWASLMREALEPFVSSSEQKPPAESESLYLAQRVFRGIPSWARSEDEQAVVRELMRWLTKRAGPLIRFSAYAALAGRPQRPQDGPVHAKAALDLLLKEILIQEPYQRTFITDSAGIRGALSALKDESEAYLSYCRKMLEPALNSDDPERLLKWDWVMCLWLEKLRDQGRSQEADAMAGRVVETFAKHRSKRVAIPHWVREAWEKKRVARVKAGQAPPLPAEWSDCDITPVPISNRARQSRLWTSPAVRLAAMAIQEKKIVLLWARHAPQGIRVRLTSLPTAGGDQISLGEAAMKNRQPIDGPPLFPDQTLCLAVEGTRAYVGWAQGGLATFEEGRVTVWTEENGLPSDCVAAVAPFERKLYVGMGRAHIRGGVGAFAELDLATDQFKILCSGRSQQKLTPLHGGRPYVVRAILPDPKRGCLWLGVIDYERGPDTRQGLWTYDPRAGKFRQRWKGGPLRAILGVSRLCWHGERILTTYGGMFCGRTELLLFGPETMAEAVLVRWHPARPAAPPVIDLPWSLDERATFLSDGRILIGGRRLYLLNPKEPRKKPQFLTHMPDGQDILKDWVISMQPYPGGVILGTVHGSLWRVRPIGSRK